MNPAVDNRDVRIVDDAEPPVHAVAEADMPVREAIEDKPVWLLEDLGVSIGGTTAARMRAVDRTVIGANATPQKECDSMPYPKLLKSCRNHTFFCEHIAKEGNMGGMLAGVIIVMVAVTGAGVLSMCVDWLHRKR